MLECTVILIVTWCSINGFNQSITLWEVLINARVEFIEDNFSFTGLDHTLMHEDPVQRLPMVATPNSTLEWADQLKFALRTEFKMPSTVIESLDF